MAILPLFTDHSRLWRANKLVYPVISRRSRGLSIGVNLNPDRICNFDCVYCCVDRRPEAEAPAIDKVDLDLLKVELERTLAVAVSGDIWKGLPFDQTPAHLRRINDVAFSGDGEPTSYPRFEEACRVVSGVLAEHNRRDVKIVVITNATLFHQMKVKAALSFLDEHNGEIWAKLEAGTQDYYQQVERTSIPLARVLDNILQAGKVRPIVIQSLFMKLNDVAVPEAEVQAYIERLNELKTGGCLIKLVQIYTIARGTAEAYCAPLPKAMMDELTDKVRVGTGLNVETFYGPD